MTAAPPSSTVSLLGPGLVRRPRRIALLGNPNVGKSCIFNALTGLRQRVSNYPGITVERAEGTLHTPAGAVQVVDLPGTYSLHARSPDEHIARDELLGQVEGRVAPDVVVVVADASNLERSLYLTTQVIGTGARVVVALNQMDIAHGSGHRVDPEKLAGLLGVPVVATCGRTGSGRDELVEAILTRACTGKPAELNWPDAVRCAAGRLAPLFAGLDPAWCSERRLRDALVSETTARALVEFLKTAGPDGERASAAFLEERGRLEVEGIDVAICSATVRYEAVEELAADCVEDLGHSALWQLRLDRFLTHPLSGTVVLLSVFAFLFAVVFSWSGPAIEFVDGALSQFGGWLAQVTGGGLFGAFLEEGLVAGFGAFLVFVPQIAMLFVCIEALEDSGYLARAAFLLDRVMGRAGLPGRAFLPLLSGFACAIPGIMAARTIENRRDRFVTMAVLPLMSCQARLPVYAVVTGALFTQFGGWVPAIVVLSMYLVGIGVAFLGAKLLRRTVMPGARSPLLLELPAYRAPSIMGVLRNTGRRTWTFVAGAGPVILVLSMVLWGLSKFPGDVTYSRDFPAEIAALEAQAEGTSDEAAADLQEGVATLEAARSAERLAHSWIGRGGKLIEPAIEPLGFDWKMGVAVLASFAAREVFVPTLGVTYAVGDDADEESKGLLESMQRDKRPDGRPVFTPLVGISLMVFYVIALQCMSTLAVLRRETNSWRWPLGLFAAMSILAWVASFVVYQAGTALGY